jgi:hypothetical protein
LLESLALRHRDDLADDMIEATHLENLPWDKVYNKEGRKQQLIPYELAIRTQELDEVVAIAASSREIRENYR